MNSQNIIIDIPEELSQYIKEQELMNNDELENLNSNIEQIIKLLLSDNNINSKNIIVSIDTANLEEIRKLNKEYRGVDKSTDVLSFPIFSVQELEQLKQGKGLDLGVLNLGDIYLCLDKIKEQSIEYGTGFLRELLYMITHSMCHLLGYDHETQEDKAIMRNQEEKILNKMGVFK